MNKVRTYCLLLILLILIGWGGARSMPVQAIAPLSSGLDSSEKHPVDRIEAAKLAGQITPDEAALYKLYAFVEPDKLPSQFQFKGTVTEWPRSVASGYIPPSFFSGTTVFSITRPHYITAFLSGAAP